MRIKEACRGKVKKKENEKHLEREKRERERKILLEKWGQVEWVKA